MTKQNETNFTKAYEIAAKKDEFTQSFVSKLYRHGYTYTDEKSLPEILALLDEADITYEVTVTNEYRDGSKEFKVEIR